MKVLQINWQENSKNMKGITNQQINTKYKEGVANRVTIKTFKQ